MTPFRHPIFALSALVAAGALALSACGGDDDTGTAASTPTPTTAAGAQADAVADTADAPTPDRTITFTATDFAFTGPTAVEAGVVELAVDNQGGEDHQLGLFRLNDGVDAGTVLGAVGAAGTLEAGREYGTWIAGPNLVAPTKTGSVVMDLQPGHYLVACVMPSASDGQPHAMKGMLANLEVTPTDAPAAAIGDSELPTIQLKDFDFVLPDDFTGNGPTIVRNEGSQIHELAIVRLADGSTPDDVMAYEMQPPPRTNPPYTSIGGTTFLDPGERVRLDLDLEPGNYALICFLPAPDKQMHAQHGMLQGFSVT
jgi:uncharacterized cupredoxin-like copper-binding protein